MINDRIKLGNAELVLYVLSRYEDISLTRKRPMVVVCPGGGYEFLANREAEGIALMFNAAGINAAVLYYSVTQTLGKDPAFPTSLCELSQAVAYIRGNAERLGVDETQIAVCGFSAGGHLAASLAVMYHETWLDGKTQTTAAQRKPDALILGYPVILAEGPTHKGTIKRLVGENPSQQQLDSVSLEKHVTPNMVPTFIWSTFTDATVPVWGSMKLAEELYRNNISCELHVFRYGEHGLGLATSDQISVKHPAANPAVAKWTELAVTWLGEVFGNGK